MKFTTASLLILLSPLLSFTTANPVNLDQSLALSKPRSPHPDLTWGEQESGGLEERNVHATDLEEEDKSMEKRNSHATDLEEEDSGLEERYSSWPSFEEEAGLEERAQTIGEKILAKAETAKGTPYVWGGGSCSGKTSGGFDCSGLVSWAVCQVTGHDFFKEGLRVTYNMYCASDKKRGFKKIPYSQRRAGDAVFFGGKCDCSHGWGNSNVHHVGLMTNSGTKMWNALKTGTKVREDDFGNWNEKPCPYVVRFS